MIYCTFDFNNSHLTFEFQKYEKNPSMIYTQKYRKPIAPGIENKNIASKEEFLKDIGFQLSIMYGKPFEGIKSCQKALYEAIKYHINQHGRIIDIDLQAYLDCTMHIMEATSCVNDITGPLLREHILNQTIIDFKSKLWINTNNGLEKYK